MDLAFEPKKQVSKDVRGVNGIKPNPVDATCMAASITASWQLNWCLDNGFGLLLRW
ncbi:hypothetical protein DY78_GL000732 [Lactiplantibacillus fabifermentans DSM 21115]|uniref:Uncharacterized protein n=1 Tax=Lactiplantibacillus fabifermentans DSM 21115 TaxID=1413187 RepID=A0A0R2NLP1_9LACO|nr:hypothetical protein DY78_GL000732 [Lactiplantibacillus fabifermentans DSM 21115]